MYKCLYDDLKDECDAVASYIFTTYQVTTWNRLLAANNCSISKYIRLLVLVSTLDKSEDTHTPV